MYLKELRTKESGRLQQYQGFAGDCAGNLGDVLAHLLTPPFQNAAPGLAQTPPHCSPAHTHWTQHHPPLGWIIVSPPLAIKAHRYSSSAFLQFSHHGKPTGGLEMVLTNCLFLFRLTGFRALRHRGMWLFHFAFVFWFLHLFYKANKGKKTTNQP